jgi:LPS export ABC transporter protein LptC
MSVRRRGPAVAALAAAFALANCSAKAPPAGPARPASHAGAKPAASAIPINVSANRVGKRYVFLTTAKANRKLYVLRADRERGHYSGTDTGVSTFVNPHIIFYGRDGKQLVADAPTGTVVEKEKTVRMSGGVRARAQDGMTLHCDTLRYDDETDLLHGIGNVTVISPQGEELQGETLTWNLRDGSIDVAGAR